jgi:hypothetical protein
MIKQVEAVAKFDYVKAGQDFIKAFQPTTLKSNTLVLHFAKPQILGLSLDQ